LNTGFTLPSADLDMDHLLSNSCVLFGFL
jgi:hypothetical protein